MTGVYFPSHVFILFRRLVNVVSTLSISKHCVSSNAPAGPDDVRAAHKGDDILNSLRDSTHRLKALAMPETVECSQSRNWPWLMIRQTWDKALFGTICDIWEMRNTIYLQDPGRPTSTPELPNWVPGKLSWSWPSLFSSPSSSDIQPEGDPTPPQTPTSSSSSPQPARKENEPLNEESSTQKKPPVNFPMPSEAPQPQAVSSDIIHQLLANPALYDPIRTPRFPIVLSHGLYGFDTRGPTSFPSMRMHYWSNVLRVLRGVVGAEVIVTSVPGTGSIISRADRLHEQLKTQARGRGINFLAHSMGGLDCRHLISHIRPNEYVPLSLTTIGTPHRGSPFMDWCANNIGIGKLRQQEKELEELRKSGQQDHNSSSLYDEDEVYYPAARVSKSKPPPLPSGPSSQSSFSFSSLPSSFTTLLLSIVDSPAYANLLSSYLTEVFNPSTPDDPRVKYWSVAGRLNATNVNIWHPFWLPKMVLDGWEESERVRIKEEGTSNIWEDEREWGNDGLVTIQSAKWGEFLGTMEGCDHWEMRGARGIEFGVDLPALPAFGLGKSPHPTSTISRHRPIPSSTAAAQQAQGDGWGFGDWMKFVGAWKKSESDEAAVAAKNAGMETESKSEKDERERRREEEAESALKISTDKMSVVFDWLIERVPAPTALFPPGSNKKNLSEAEERRTEKVDEVVRKSAVTFTVGVGSSSSSVDPTSTTRIPQESKSRQKRPLAEMKHLMESEHMQRAKKRELASRQDLERFYIALAKRMWDSGL